MSANRAKHHIWKPYSLVGAADHDSPKIHNFPGNIGENIEKCIDLVYHDVTSGKLKIISIFNYFIVRFT